jgi:hypothetical protein
MRKCHAIKDENPGEDKVKARAKDRGKSTDEKLG